MLVGYDWDGWNAGGIESEGGMMVERKVERRVEEKSWWKAGRKASGKRVERRKVVE